MVTQDEIEVLGSGPLPLSESQNGSTLSWRTQTLQQTLTNDQTLDADFQRNVTEILKTSGNVDTESLQELYDRYLVDQIINFVRTSDEVAGTRFPAKGHKLPLSINEYLYGSEFESSPVLGIFSWARKDPAKAAAIVTHANEIAEAILANGGDERGTTRFGYQYIEQLMRFPFSQDKPELDPKYVIAAIKLEQCKTVESQFILGAAQHNKSWSAAIRAAANELQEFTVIEDMFGSKIRPLEKIQFEKYPECTFE